MKNITTAMQSHLNGETTTLATLWRVTRTDGAEFFFTDHDVDILFDGYLYEARTGYQRTAIQNDITLSVDNLDIQGILSSDKITDQELRAGKFDYAKIFISIVNWADLTMGAVKMRRGLIGEVTLTERGVFSAELRGMTQQLSQVVGELYQPECRADLGDSRCRFPIEPAVRGNSTAYAVGDIIRVATNGNGDLTPSVRLQIGADTNTNDDSRYADTGTLGAEASRSTATTKYGAGSVEFTPTATVDPSASYLSFADDTRLNISSQQFCIETWVRFKSLAATVQTIAAQSDTAGNQRAWVFQRNGNALEFEASSDGTGFDILRITGSFTWQIDTWYHVAVSRDNSTIRLFVDGDIVASKAAASSIFNSSSDLYIGKKREPGGSDAPLNGFIDDFRLTVTSARYTEAFSPPSAALPLVPANTQQSAYYNRLYECTTAGVSNATATTYDTTVGNETVDGTATFKAHEAYTRHGWIESITDRSTLVLSDVGYSGVGDVDGWYNSGTLVFEDGSNAGLAIEIRDWVQSTRTLTLFMQTPYAVEPGTAVRFYPGCDKRAETCRVKFDFGEYDFAGGNIKNFRGEPFIPGRDELSRYPDAN